MFVSKTDSRDEFDLPWPGVYNSYRQAWQAALDQAADFWESDEVYLESTASEKEAEFQPGTIVARVSGTSYYVYQVHLDTAEKNCYVSAWITEYIKSLMDLKAPDSIYNLACDEVGTEEVGTEEVGTKEPWRSIARKMLAAAVAVAPPQFTDSMLR